MKIAKPGSCPAQEKFLAARQELAATLIERDDEIDLVLTGLIAQEHVLLVGQPGTAKSLLLDAVLGWMHGLKFTVLLTKFSTPEELFGPASVAGLKEDRFRRITTGKLPEADGALIDELFKGRSAVLNTSLSLLTERVFDPGDGVPIRCPLRLCVAASSVWPARQEDGADLN